jgi:PQQ-dependent dehydrogenase (s-GDH family)
MKNIIVWLLCPALLFPSILPAQGEPFTRTVLNEKSGSGNYRLAHPFDVLYGADDHLYITEKIGRVCRVDTGTGQRQIILDISNIVYLDISRNGGGQATGIGQNGMLGLALHPNFNKSTGQDSVFVAYSYDAHHIRIVRYKYNGGASPFLDGPTVLIEDIPAGHDHSTGRLIVGGDNKLYYSCGDLGHNQFDERCETILSQTLPSQTAINNENYDLYSGKILRLNMDGSIPADNPLWNSVRSHIYTIGHRNPQGLVWEKDPSGGFTSPALTAGGKLFSSEHGPNTDDEINSIESGRNYGWPYIAGDTDEVNYQYVNWSTASNCNQSFVESPFYIPNGATVMQERNAPLSVKNNFRKPLVRAYTVCTPRPASECEIANGWLKYPTIAPSSIEYYQLNTGRGIPNWFPSLLVPTLRTGTMFRFRLNAAKDAVIGDSIAYFNSDNRYRDITLSPDGKIYIVTDSIGSTSGPSGSNNQALEKRGAILVFQYSGVILPWKEKPNVAAPEYVTSVYPNPARTYIKVETEPAFAKPVRYVLTDLSGKTAVQGSSSLHHFTIDAAHLHRGVYVLRLYTVHGAVVRMEKIILQ